MAGLLDNPVAGRFADNMFLQHKLFYPKMQVLLSSVQSAHHCAAVCASIEAINSSAHNLAIFNISSDIV